MLAQRSWLLSKSPETHVFRWQSSVSVPIPWCRGPCAQQKGTRSYGEAVHQGSVWCICITSDRVYSPNNFFDREEPTAFWSDSCLRRFECNCQVRAAEPVLFHGDLWHRGHDAAIYHQPLSFPNWGLSHDNTERHRSFTDLVSG